MADLAAGREAAFTLLYDQFAGRLYRAARAIVERHDEAEDAVQEVFLAVVRGRARLGEVRDLAAYLFKALRHAAARRAAQPRGLVLFDDFSATGVAARSYDPDGHRTALREAMTFLPLEQREVIALKIDAQLTFAQIAAALEISPNTAASRYRYALERLRTLLREDSPHE